MNNTATALTPYKATQNKLKKLRAQGYELQVKLGAKQEVLIAELQRIEKLIAEEIQQLESVETQSSQTAETAKFYRVLPGAEKAAKRLDAALLETSKVNNESVIRINRRSEATANLINHLTLCFSLILTLLSLCLTLPNSMLKDVEAKALHHAPETIALLVWVGDRAIELFNQWIKPDERGAIPALEAVFCLR